MKLSRHILDFIFFAGFVLLALVGFFICWFRYSSLDWLFFVGAVLAVGIICMIWSLVRWIAAGVTARRKTEASEQKF